MKYILSIFTVLILFACNQQEEKPKHEIQGLFNQGDTVNISYDAGKLIASSPDKQVIMIVTESKDSFYTVITQQAKTGTYTYNETSIDTFTKKYSGGVVVPPPPVDPPPTGTRANLIFENSFEGSPFTGFTTANHQYCCDYSITHVAAPDGIGKALKYDLRKSDPTVSSSKRAEIQLAGPSGANTLDGMERWYGLRYWLQTYTIDEGAESILQWHDTDGSNPPLSIQVQGGRLRLTQSFRSGNTHTDLGPATTGKWINIVLHVKWSNDNTGLIECWYDGVKKVAKTNIRTNSAGGSYMKIGINKWSWAPNGGTSTATQRVFYIDDFRYGTEKATYKDVAP